MYSYAPSLKAVVPTVFMVWLLTFFEMVYFTYLYNIYTEYMYNRALYAYANVGTYTLHAPSLKAVAPTLFMSWLLTFFDMVYFLI
jgi:hypothetical protein